VTSPIPTRLGLSVLALALTANLSACVVVHGCDEGLVEDGAGHCVAPLADITFLWSIGGDTCSQAPEVATIHISLTGPNGREALENGGLFYCRTAGVDGISLQGFGLGDYHYTIDGLDPSGRILYGTEGSFALTQSMTVSVVLRAIHGCEAGLVEDGAGHCVAPTADITFLWSIGGDTCSQAPEVATIHISLTGPNGREALENGGMFYCRTAGVDGISLQGFGLGDYHYTIDGLDPSGRVLYWTEGSFTLTRSMTVSVVLR
jgi:hypothetical protein